MKYKVFWIISFIILAIIAIVFIILYFRCLFTRIDPNKCIMSGNYVLDNNLSLPILNTCGDSGSDPCTFTAQNFGAAVDLCNNSDLCLAFNYTPGLNTVSYGDTSKDTIISPNIYLFTKIP